MRTFPLILIAWLLAVAAPALAGPPAPLFYSRANIAITRQSIPLAEQNALPWQAATRTVGLEVEIRDSSTLYNQKGWFNLSSPSEKNGVMIVFSAPALAPVVRSTQYVPLDVLMIDKQGRILQILPEVMLNDLEEDIYPPAPVLALLFIKGGLCKSLSINPGDDIEYKLFKKPPAVITAQQPPQPAAPRAAAPIPVMPPLPAPAEAPMPKPLSAPTVPSVIIN